MSTHHEGHRRGGEETNLIDHHHQISVMLENYKQTTMTPQVYSRLLLPNTMDNGYLSNSLYLICHADCVYFFFRECLFLFEFSFMVKFFLYDDFVEKIKYIVINHFNLYKIHFTWVLRFYDIYISWTTTYSFTVASTSERRYRSTVVQ